MKAILVIDKMPNGCWKCPLHSWDDEDNWVGCQMLFGRQTGCMDDKFIPIPNGCPLKPMPEAFEEPIEISTSREINFGYMLGYNACLDDILGEDE